MSEWLDPLRRILDRSLEPVRFFFLDNNVGLEEECLYELLDVFAAHAIPIELGVIPDLLNESLAKNLQARLAASHRGLAVHVVVPHPSARRAYARAHRPGAAAVDLRRHSGDTTDPAEAAHAPDRSNAATLPVRVDWSRHHVSESGGAPGHLGRRIAIAASRQQPVVITLNHAGMARGELVAIEELLLLLANHRKAECLLMRDLSADRTASGAGRSVSVPRFRAPAETGMERSWLGRMSPSHARSRWALAALIAVASAIAWHWFGGAKPGTDWLTAPVRRGAIESAVLAAGTVQPYAYVDVGAQTSGQLKSLKVRLGDRVKKDQLLAEIDPVISAARVAEAAATLANLEAQWAGKRAQLELATQQKLRTEELMQHGAQATSDVEIAQSNYKLAQSKVQALAAQIKQARAALQTAQATLAYTRIVAPMSGEVVSISALEGQTLNATQQAPTILRLAELDTMTVWALVPEADVSRLRIGQEVYFTVLGQGERPWYGRLKQILPSPQVIANVVFYNALFDVPNPQRELKVQMTAQVFFVLARVKDGLYVPLSALADAQAGRATVRVLKDDGSIETRTVRTGITNAVSAQVLSGLNAGETVITGAANLKQDRKSSPLHNFKPR